MNFPVGWPTDDTIICLKLRYEKPIPIFSLYRPLSEAAKNFVLFSQLFRRAWWLIFNSPLCGKTVRTTGARLSVGALEHLQRSSILLPSLPHRPSTHRPGSPFLPFVPFSATTLPVIPPPRYFSPPLTVTL